MTSASQISFATSQSWFLVFSGVAGNNTYFFIEQSSNANSNSGMFFYGQNGALYFQNRAGTFKNYYDTAAGSNVSPFSAGVGTIAAFVDSNLTGTFTSNGTVRTLSNSGTASTLANNQSDFVYINRRVAATSHFGELIVFNAALTTAQRQQVEGYLAWKWGISSSFQPTSISGLSLWLDAADSTTLTLSGSNVTQWRDKSVNAMTATPSNGNVWMSNQNGYTGVYVNNNNSVLAPGTTRLTLSSNFMTFSNYTFLGVVEFTTLGTNQTVFSDQRGASGESRTQLGITQSFETDSVGNLRILSLTDISNRQILGWTSLPSAFTAFRNGSSLASNTTTFSTYGTDAGALPSLGAPSGTSDNRFMTGWFYEVIMYSSNLTTDQRQQVEDYLSRKWNISLSRTILNLPSSHPFRLAPPVLRPFVPTDIANCALWLDAADRKTITLSGSNVTAWTDKSGNGYSFTASGTSPTYTSSVRNGLGALTLNGTGGMYNATATVQLATRSVFFVVEQTAGTTTQFQGILALGASGTTNDFGSFVSASYSARGSNEVQNQQVGVIANYGNANYYNTGSGVYASGATPFGLYVDVFATTTGTFYANGTSTQTDTANSGFGTGTGIAVGSRYFSSATSVYLNGYIYEIVIFNSALSTAQRQQVEAYLATKWGLQGSTPSTHPARIAPALTVQFQPTLLSNCALWLDAADQKTLTFSGSNVTAWADKSGNGRSSTGFGGTTLQKIGNNTAITLNGTDTYFYFSNATAMNTTTTLSAFVVAVFGSGMTSTPRLLGFGNTDWDNVNNAVAFGRHPSTDSRINFERATGNGGTPTQVLTPPTSFVGSTIFTSTGATQWVNGTANASNTTSLGAFNYNLYNIGRFSGGGLNWTGAIGEVIAFNSALSTTDRQQVEGYLATKWGLQGSLPASHPYKNTPLL
jgi:hypothetical protein